MVGYIRRNVLVPVPRVKSLQELQQHMDEKCRQYQNKHLRYHARPVLAIDLPIPLLPPLIKATLFFTAHHLTVAEINFYISFFKDLFCYVDGVNHPWKSCKWRAVHNSLHYLFG